MEARAQGESLKNLERHPVQAAVLRLSFITALRVSLCEGSARRDNMKYNNLL